MDNEPTQLHCVICKRQLERLNSPYCSEECRRKGYLLKGKLRRQRAAAQKRIRYEGDRLKVYISLVEHMLEMHEDGATTLELADFLKSKTFLSWSK